ncbi:MAG TPA: efflux RND transporter periplasmic adaptor subunit [Aquabacterium sp.]|nr:efflux RND transporter periplasmic adaptor subunit [Aquabacterium sp.]
MTTLARIPGTTRTRLVGVGALLLLVAVALWMAWRPTAVAAVKVQRLPLSQTLQFTARVKTPQRVDVGVTVTGRVAQVLVREGDRVQAGAPLIQLEADEARAAWLQAQAAQQQAQARRVSQQQLSLPNAQAALAQAEATLAAAERDWVRTQELVARQFYSQARLDEAQRSVAIARAQRDAARAQVQANGARGAEDAAAQAQAASARAAVAVALARLEQTTVRAPGAGRVLVREVEPGQIVQAGKRLMTLAVSGPAELVAQVDERYLHQLHEGQRASVLADAYPQQPFAAQVVRLAPSVNAQSGSVEVTLLVAGTPPAFLREDMTLSVEVLTGQRPPGPVLPLRAVRDAVRTPQGEQGTVLVATDGRAQARAVRLGLRALDQVEILGGLSDGESVLLDPTVPVGTRVRLVRDAAPAPGTLSRDGAGGMAQGFAR